MESILWPLLLLLAAIGFIILEMFIPSGGILSVLALAAVIASVVTAFTNGGMGTGIAFLALSAVVVPTVIALAIRWWPKTPMGRLIINEPPKNEDEFLPNDEESLRLRELVGKQGISKSVMLPAGVIIVDNRRYNALTEGMPVDEGQVVEVTRVEGSRILVRPADQIKTEQEPSDDILSQPAEKFGLDSLDDPLA